MQNLRYSKEMNEVVIVQDELTAEEALQLLCDELLGENYYIADPVSGKQANVIKVRAILTLYGPKKKLKW